MEFSQADFDLLLVAEHTRKTSEIGPLRCWLGGLCLLRSIGDMDVGEFIVPVPYVKQVKAFSWDLFAKQQGEERRGEKLVMQLGLQVNKPSVIFIDEIDALATRRQGIFKETTDHLYNAATQERETTLNQLLMEVELCI
ncbi:hypothetical protein ES332_A11G332600v1 [Gossypium tomentosum]|uniref:ATPase AAA-type core domain-containing protein n=1 Tax=Gossypium tomentosum TaxID=34277 RepID=A0A5D2NGV6_GOSTO|nr:hypothetical protein ES332_A11G332600v1 [Gossypium tomentosum]